MASSVTASAPGKLMLLGEHAVMYGHSCIVTAVDQRMRATVGLTDDNSFTLQAPHVHVHGYVKPMDELMLGEVPKGARFIEQALVFFRESHPFSGGVHTETSSDFSSLFGFGSSSASTVAFLKALSEVTGARLDARSIFDLAYKTVLAVQGKGSGFDVASAAWGGTMRYVRGGEIAELLPEHPFTLVVGYTGMKADTTSIVTQVAEKAQKDQERVDGLYRRIGTLVAEGETVFRAADWKRFGEVMNKNQELLSDLGVSSEILDRLITVARGAGALGAKLSGAGVGDCMIALGTSETEQAIGDAITRAGGTIIPVRVSAPPARVD